MTNTEHLENKKSTKEKQITLVSTILKGNRYYVLVSLEYQFSCHPLS